MEETSITNKKKMVIAIFIVILLFIILSARIGYIQFVKGQNLQEMAYDQLVKKRTINAKRGKMYDSTEKYVLAVSATVYTVTVNPTNISNDNKEKVAKGLSDIFELNYDDILKKVTKRSSIETIVKKIDEQSADKLRGWLIENNIETGVNIDEDTKRYYPYNTLASQIIGFCGSDNQGLDGIEAKYDAILSGTNGSIWNWRRSL